MRIKTISIEFRQKVNLGDYESAEVSCWACADVDEDEDAEVVGKVLCHDAKGIVYDELREICKHHNRMPASVKYFYAGKEVVDKSKNGKSPKLLNAFVNDDDDRDPRDPSDSKFYIDGAFIEDDFQDEPF